MRPIMLDRQKARATGRVSATRVVAATALAFAWGPARAANPAAPLSLKHTAVPEPPELYQYVKDKRAAIALGKALFWDMQVGSDGVACATCHFHAGADGRSRNQLSPGLNGGDHTFQTAGPNARLTAADFPLHKLSNGRDRLSTVIRDSNDAVASQGVFPVRFTGVLAGTAKEMGTPTYDPDFSVQGVNVRRVEPRNAPTVINAVFNFNNFWDGRASNVFNGASPFGETDPSARIYVNDGSLAAVAIQIHLASLASQAVGPPGSPFEMSYAGRSFADIGKKLLRVRPLGRQMVHPQDSVLGELSRAPKRRPGLATTYRDMVEAAFLDRYWNATGQVVHLENGNATITPAPPRLGPRDFSQMEANFSLFFGLAVQLYEATLVSDDSPFDRYQDGDENAMSASAKAGLQLFLTPVDPEGAFAGGSCVNCHAGAEFTKATVSHIGSIATIDERPEALVERMAGGSGAGAFYDSGYYNIGVRPTGEDKGRGGDDPFGYPLSFTKRALLVDGMSGPASSSPFALGFWNPVLPCCPLGTSCSAPCSLQAPAVDGAFKTPTLRNVELTGPYFHNGGAATLMQVLDFYTRGGDFHEQNLATLAPDVDAIPGMTDLAQRELVDFLLALTDERVRWEEAPFDHPELFVPEGSPGDSVAVSCKGSKGCDSYSAIPAVGAGGRKASGLPPLGTFLGLDPDSR